MKLAIISDGLVHRSEDGYFSRDTFFYFITDHLSRHFERIWLCTPVRKASLPPGDCPNPPVRPESVTIVETIPYETVSNFYKKLPVIAPVNLARIMKPVRDSDALFLRIPAMNSFAAFLLAKIWGKPIISYLVGDEEEIVRKGGKYRGFAKKIATAAALVHRCAYRYMISSSSAALFLNPRLMKKFPKEDNAYFTFTSLIKKDDIRPRKSLEIESPLCLLYTGRLSHEKGVEYLLYSARLLLDREVLVRLFICGDGPERGRLEDLCKDLKLENHVKFLGYVSYDGGLDRIYDECDIFVLPSISEGVPKVLLEAMAKGVPVIATRTGGIPDIIEDMHSGILVPPGSPEAITRAVELLLRDGELRKRMVERGYEFAMHHTAEEQAGRIAAVIKKQIVKSETK